MEQFGIERDKLPELEQELSDLLDEVCEKLYPTNGYKLHLQGLVPDTVTLKGLEAYNGVHLDTSKGAKITLSYDSISRQLGLESLVHPIDKQPQSTFVIRATSNRQDGLRYIPYLDNMGGGRFPPAEAKKDEPLKNEKVARILNGYGIKDIPHPSQVEYSLWRANLLSNCKEGWRLSEEVELFVDMQENTTDTVKIGVREEYQEGVKVSREKYLSYIHTTHAPSGERVDQNISTLLQVDSDYGRALYISSEAIVKELDPFIENDDSTVLAHHIEALPIDGESVRIFDALIKDATTYLIDSKDI
jgi:hypothetical protein